VLAELLVAEGAVAGDLNDHLDFSLPVGWDAFVLFGHSDGVCWSMVIDVSSGKMVGLYICGSHESALYERKISH